MGEVTKIVRLFRLPRLFRIINVKRFNALLGSLMSGSSKSGQRDEKIVTRYIVLYVYRIIRLIIIAMFITYFIGCFWFYFCNFTTEPDQSSKAAGGEVMLDETDFAGKTGGDSIIPGNDKDKIVDGKRLLTEEG